MKICVYTAIFGGYTELKRPYIPVAPDLRDPWEVSLVCFSDRPISGDHGWEVRERESVFEHPRMNSKWFRMNPHIELRDFDVTIWVDANFQLGDIRFFVQECLDALRSAPPETYGSALFRDPECTDIYDEAAYSLQRWPNKYLGQPMTEQVTHYLKEGLPSPHAMFAGGIHVRDNRATWTHALNLRWFAECVRWSYQDQLSLPFVLWKLGRTCTVIPGNIYLGNNWQWVMVKEDH